VGRGKTIGRFGSRAMQMLKTVQNKYFVDTSDSILVREKMTRARQLNQTMKSIMIGLHKQQLEILRNQIIESFRNKLKVLAVESVESSDFSQDSSVGIAVEESLEEYRNKCILLNCPSMNLDSTYTENSLLQELKGIAKAFPESSTGKLCALKRFEKNSITGTSKKKNKRSFNVALSLVGMLRPPGFGNLQGFLGYSTGIFGLPLDFLLGVQNDGDSAEVKLTIIRYTFVSYTSICHSQLLPYFVGYR
jgi:hypothetical protein